MKDQEACFKPIINLDIVRVEDVGLTHFLCDEDIRNEMISLYGGMPRIEKFTEQEKQFFFKDGDSSFFKISGDSIGMN